MMRKAGLWLSVMALVAGTCGANAQPSADAYPNQTVRIVVPFSAGSITDGLARVLADELAKAWKQSVIVENRPGIAGLYHSALAHDDDAVTDVIGGREVVGNVDDGDVIVLLQAP